MPSGHAHLVGALYWIKLLGRELINALAGVRFAPDSGRIIASQRNDAMGQKLPTLVFPPMEDNVA